MEKQRYKVTGPLLLSLERWTETISSSQGSSTCRMLQTHWTFEVGTKPGEWMMGHLECRTEAISGEFNSQNVTNTLWAFATMGTKSGERMMGQLE